VDSNCYIFLKLVSVLTKKTNLASHYGKGNVHVTVGEKIMISLYLLSGHSNRDAQERFQHIFLEYFPVSTGCAVGPGPLHTTTSFSSFNKNSG
jgi:hypothetical protein